MPEVIDPEKKPSQAVPLDGPAFSPDRLTVRGRDLNEARRAGVEHDVFFLDDLFIDDLLRHRGLCEGQYRNKKGEEPSHADNVRRAALPAC